MIPMNIVIVPIIYGVKLVAPIGTKEAVPVNVDNCETPVNDRLHTHR
jgi:hypothetical protein